jgi:GT2 family glycosyltransferase/glycosyltransferase involved in cell wall biosynthesis
MLHVSPTRLPRLARNAIVRFLDTRARVVGPAFVPVNIGDTIFGYVESIVWRSDRVTLRGWVHGGTLRATVGNEPPVAIVPSLERPDVVSATGHAFPATCGFALDLMRPWREAGLSMSIDTDAGRWKWQAPAPTARQERTARLRALPSAMLNVGRHGGAILRFVRTGDPALSTMLRHSFGFAQTGPESRAVHSDLFADDFNEDFPQGNSRPVAIIVPVYNAHFDVKRLLSHLPDSIGMDHHLILVNDGSDDTRIAPLLDDHARRHSGTTTVLTMPENQGFIAAVNAGLEAARELGEHVILLNTDTLPPRHWAARLVRPILSDPAVATVTPLSNTAEIASIPVQGVASEISAEVVNAIDSVARRFAPRFRNVDIPTGIGFCMAMNRRFLDRIGPFDPAFGRGYGEEVDWCQKARKAGGRHVLVTNLFVGHEGGASFGSQEKLARVQENNRVISARYPNYDRDVREWADAAPHYVQRLTLSLAWLALQSDAPVPIYLAHSFGGGAEMALGREIEADLQAGAPGVIVIRVGGQSPWRVELKSQGFDFAGDVHDMSLVLALLAPVSARKVVYSCGVGAFDPAQVPELLLGLLAGPDNTLDVRLHDYFPISPSYCLLDGAGHFGGVPDIATTDPAHQVRSGRGRAILDHREWRSLWARVLARSRTITAYSPASRDILASAYPDVASRIRLEPHETAIEIAELAAGGAAIGVLGGINQAKGAGVLSELANHYAHASDPRRIVIVGGLDPQFTLRAPHVVHGPFGRDQIAELARHYGVGVWLIPSIWPETFSFTTREALATGLPVLCFDLGAQAEAVKGAANGVLLPDPGEIADIATAIEDAFRNCASR